MLTILGALCSPLDGDDHLDLMRLRDTNRLQETLTGPCEDDKEVCCPLLDAREHVDAFLSRPLKFGGAVELDFAEQDAAFQLFLRLGFDYSMHASICAQAHANGRDPYAVAS